MQTHGGSTLHAATVVAGFPSLGRDARIIAQRDIVDLMDTGHRGSYAHSLISREHRTTAHTYASFALPTSQGCTALTPASTDPVRQTVQVSTILVQQRAQKSGNRESSKIAGNTPGNRGTGSTCTKRVATPHCLVSPLIASEESVKLPRGLPELSSEDFARRIRGAAKKHCDIVSLVLVPAASRPKQGLPAQAFSSCKFW